MRSALLALPLALLMLLVPAAAQGGGAPDLRLHLQLHEREVAAGQAASMGFNLTNAGAATATDVVVRIDAPEDATIVWGYDCEIDPAGSFALCAVPDLPPGATVGHSFDVRFDVPGHHDVVAQASLAQADADPEDNVAVYNVTVIPSAPQDLTCSASSEGNLLGWRGLEPGTEFTVYRGGDILVRTEESRYLDSDVAVGQTYSYRVTWFDGHMESAAARCELTAVPFFPGVLAGALAGLVAIAAYVTLRRR
ncbi:MAG TPA: hypothetical protein VM582_06655 [Candidatus Thermoplasmatota archaeon]|nr:hypothetical protein [Candidatus Thermoplasmatota archaeon]